MIQRGQKVQSILGCGGQKVISINFQHNDSAAGDADFQADTITEAQIAMGG